MKIANTFRSTYIGTMTANLQKLGHVQRFSDYTGEA